MKLVPLFDRVVLEKEKMEETTASGIVLPGQNDKEKPGQALVVAVGPGGVVDGKDITMQVKVGDHVLFSKYAGSEVEVDGHKYTVRQDAASGPRRSGQGAAQTDMRL